MTEKFALVLVIAAYLAMGTTGSLAEEHHHHHHDSKTDSDKAARLAAACYKECDFVRNECDAGGKSDPSINFCSRKRIECQKRCDEAIAQNK